MTKRFIAAFLFVLWGMPSLAEGLFLEVPEARKLVAELQTCRITGERLALCDEEAKILREEATTWKRKADALQADKLALKDANAAFEEMATKAGRDVAACEESKPSRWTWFSLGALAGVLTVFAAGMAMSGGR